MKIIARQIPKLTSIALCAALFCLTGEGARATSRNVSSQSPLAAEVVQAWKTAVYAKLTRLRVTPRNWISEHGMVVVAFSIDGRGNIVRQRIQRSSGVPVLDKSALTMIVLASPVPPPPYGINARDIEFVARIRYHSRWD